MEGENKVADPVTLLRIDMKEIITPLREAEHVAIEEVQTYWAKWLQRTHSKILGPLAMKKIRDQGNLLIRTNKDFWLDHPMSALYDKALSQVCYRW
jgi:hypothetical protein